VAAAGKAGARRAPAGGWTLGRALEALDTHYGPQDWWPAETRFEVIVGAVLTQNTSWTNVERGLGNLAAAGRLSPGGILGAGHETLATLLRPSGYFNVKARRLTAVVAWFEAEGGFDGLDPWTTDALRAALLEVHGIGPETADDILLYAFDRPVFVVDAYTKRLFSRLVGLDPGRGYEWWRAHFESTLAADAARYNQYHALIVAHGKSVCRPRPRCETCVLEAGCRYATGTGT